MRTSTQTESCLGDRRWEIYSDEPDFFEKEWIGELPPFVSPYWKIVRLIEDGRRVIEYHYLFSDGLKETWTCLNRRLDDPRLKS